MVANTVVGLLKVMQDWHLRVSLHSIPFLTQLNALTSALLPVYLSELTRHWKTIARTSCIWCDVFCSRPTHPHLFSDQAHIRIRDLRLTCSL